MDLSIPDVEPGSIYRGYLDVVERLPTGHSEQIPLIVVEGPEDGDTLWVTGSIHGDEATGMAVCQDIVHDNLPEQLSGTLVLLPNLNPAGLRRHTRTSYYDDEDPNRKFPSGEYVVEDGDPAGFESGHRPPSQQEIICRRLYDLFSDDADVLLDMHTASVGAHPFVIKDRVLYDRDIGDDDESIRNRERAEGLADRVEMLADRFGLPVMFEYLGEEYLDEGFHKSTAGAALNQAGIPALTVELGGHGVVDDDLVDRGVGGTYRVMEELGMVDDATAAFPGELPPKDGKIVDYEVRRHVGPHTDAGVAGVVRHRVAAGDVVDEGDVIATIVPPNGDPDEFGATDGLHEVRSKHRGWIIQRGDGLARYERDALTMRTVEDDGPRIWSPSDEE